DRGVTPLQARHVPPASSPVDQEPVDLGLADAVAPGCLADVDDVCSSDLLVQKGFRHEPIVDDDLGLTESAERLHGDEVWIAGAGADERDEAAHPAESSARPARGKNLCRRSSTSGSSSHGTSSRIDRKRVV